MSDSLIDILDLNEYRMMASNREIEAVKSSLKAADQRVANTEVINVNLETEVRVQIRL